MGVRLPDTIEPMGDFPAARAEHIEFSDGISLQDKFNNNELGGGGDSSSTVTQEEYEALPDEEKLNGLYYCYDSQRIYKNGVQYGESKPLELTYEEWKTLREAGAISDTQECIVAAGADGILLGANDIGYDNAVSGIQATTVQGAIDKVAEKADGLISDTDLTSTTSTLSASKIRGSVVHSFNTQDGNVRYLKLKLNINNISVVDIYGGKIEILGANNSGANPDYKTVKVVRHSYGNWSSYDATQVPSVVNTKIGNLYYYPTDNYYYLQLNNYANFTVTGVLTEPELVTSLPAETSELTLIPESRFATKSDLATKQDDLSMKKAFIRRNASTSQYCLLATIDLRALNQLMQPLRLKGVIGNMANEIVNIDITINGRQGFAPTMLFGTITNKGGVLINYANILINKSDDEQTAYVYIQFKYIYAYCDLEIYLGSSQYEVPPFRLTDTMQGTAYTNLIDNNNVVVENVVNDSSTGDTYSTWSSSKIVSYVSENSTPTYSGTVIPTAIANRSTVTTDWDITSAGSNADYGRLLMLNSKDGTFLIYVKGNLGSTSTVPTPTLISSIGNSQSASWSSSFELSISSNKLRIKNKSGAVASWRFV